VVKQRPALPLRGVVVLADATHRGEAEVSDTSANNAAPVLGERPKTLRLFDMVLFSVAAILTLDQVAAQSGIGVQGLTWWILLAVFFFVPYGLITAELGSAWPDEGGIYVWIREAFGSTLGSTMAWVYWVNVAYWAPAVFVILVGTVESGFDVDIPRVWEAVIVVALTWAIVGLGLLPLERVKWLSSATAIIKAFVMVVVGVVGIGLWAKSGLANPFDGSQWAPSFGANWAFLPLIIYSFMGFELVNSAGGAMRNPKRDVPLAIAIAGVMILLFYVLATFGILAAVPLEDLSLVSGIADALKLSLTEIFGGATWFFYLLVALIAVTLVGNMITWSLGANHTAAAAGEKRDLPRFFGHTTKRYGSPDYAYYLMGAIATVITVINYAAFANNENVFWTVFALSSIVFLIPYLLMFPALLVLRRREPEKLRPYRVPGGTAGGRICVILAWLGVAFAVVLFFQQVPEGTPRGTYWGITGVGTVVSFAIGWALARGKRGGSATSRAE
jgi:amino acid transporter